MHKSPGPSSHDLRSTLEHHGRHRTRPPEGKLYDDDDDDDDDDDLDDDDDDDFDNDDDVDEDLDDDVDEDLDDKNLEEVLACLALQELHGSQQARQVVAEHELPALQGVCHHIQHHRYAQEAHREYPPDQDVALAVREVLVRRGVELHLHQVHQKFTKISAMVQQKSSPKDHQ